MRHPFCLILAALCLNLTARADTSAPSADIAEGDFIITMGDVRESASQPKTQHVYIGNGQTLTVGAPEQLTLKSHVDQVLYQPGNLKAAYTGMTMHGDIMTTFVRLINIKDGSVTTLFSDTGSIHEDDTPYGYSLEQWSKDGHLLLTGHTANIAVLHTGDIISENVWKIVDVSSTPPKVRRIRLPEDGAGGVNLVSNVLASPSWKQFVIQGQIDPAPGKPAAEFAIISDMAHNTVRRVPLPEGAMQFGWADDRHLRLEYIQGNTVRYTVFDLMTRKETPTAWDAIKPAPVPSRFPGIGLWLSTLPLTISSPHEKSHADARTLWLNVTGPQPDLPPVPLAVSLGKYFLRRVVAPDQSSALWVQNGDLYVSRFGLETATLGERYAAGNPLTCDEEREIAENIARRIGLGIMQYRVSYDEQFPPAKNLQNSMVPFLKDARIFSVAGHPFVYTPPADLYFNNLESPAAFVLGTFTLPCAVVTLYADGHVKSLPPSTPGTLAP